MAKLDTTTAPIAWDAGVASNLSAPRGRRRIVPLDGLRAVAVVGVLYAHIWSFSLDCPPLRLGAFDINRALSVFGTGVDLFFVISGFCMYLMYGSTQSGFDAQAFRKFVLKRFKRIAPAFYVAAIVSAFFVTEQGKPFPIGDLLAHATFVFQLIPGYGRLAASFWSLGTEWHFYIVLPFFLVFANRAGFWRAAAISIGASIAFRFATNIGRVQLDGIEVDHLIPARFVEFGWGMIAAELYLKNRVPPRALQGSFGFVLSWGVSLFGRLLMTAHASSMRYGSTLQAISVVVLSFGFMLVVWNIVSSDSHVARGLSSRPMQWVGKISYSLYLWHFDSGLAAARYFGEIWGRGPLSPIGYTLLSLAFLLPISALSYRLFEAPYFARRIALTAGAPATT
jgi:peptidoglycan/LPS O-acetylase OafA/YrhL